MERDFSWLEVNSKSKVNLWWNAVKPREVVIGLRGVELRQRSPEVRSFLPERVKRWLPGLPTDGRDPQRPGTRSFRVLNRLEWGTNHVEVPSWLSSVRRMRRLRTKLRDIFSLFCSIADLVLNYNTLSIPQIFTQIVQTPSSLTGHKNGSYSPFSQPLLTQ